MINKNENIVLTELKQLFVHTDDNLCKMIIYYMKQGANSTVSYDRLKNVFIPTYSTPLRLQNTLKSMEKHKILKKIKYKTVIIYELCDD